MRLANRNSQIDMYVRCETQNSESVTSRFAILGIANLDFQNCELTRYQLTILRVESQIATGTAKKGKTLPGHV